METFLSSLYSVIKPSITHQVCSTYEAQTWADPDKREAALVFKAYWDKVRENETYQRMYEAHKRRNEDAD